VATEIKLFTDDDGYTVGSGREATRPAPPVKILLVDDEPKNLTALETVLAADDRTLVRAGSGAEALRHVLQDDFAVVLLDVHMPGMDGFETAELIRGRERSHETPIIFLTAAISGEISIARGYSLGAVDYLVKPFDPEMLRAKVNVFIELFRKTQQLRIQADELADTTAFLHSVLHGATAYAIMALDLRGGILSWNEGAKRIYGYDADEVVGAANIRTLYRPEDVAGGLVDDLLENAERDGRVVSGLDGVRKGGKAFSASVSIEQRVTADGKIGYVAIGQDVTQLKEAEQQRARLIQERAARSEAERARDRLQQVLDVLPEGILIADVDGRIVMCNAGALAIIGQVPPETDPWGQRTLERFYLDGSACPPEELPLARAAVRGEVVLGEQLLVRSASAGGALVPILMNSAPLRDQKGQIVGAVAALQDISPIKELERQKDAFLAAASHDLKNPLAIVKAQAQLLMRRARRADNPDTGAMVDGLRSIDQATRRLAGMVNELLDVARLQMGRPIELDPRPLDLAILARETAADLQLSTDRHEIVVEGTETAMVGSWDRERVERVLVNLLTNAIKYSPEGGRVVLALDRESVGGEEWALLRVRDTGIGIPAADIPHVFERFYRGSNVAGRIEGAGIGLSGVGQIVEQHGGSIEVSSVEGQGSTFTVRLPVVATEADL
jgi:PAS domain S-box-containing protein